MLKIILSRTGKKKQAYFKILVTQKERDPWGTYVENLGNYNPRSKQLELKADRVKYWLSQGAQPSATLWNMLVDKGLVEGKKKKITKISKKRAAKIEEKAKAAKETVAEPAAGPAPAEEKPAEPEAKVEAPKEEVKEDKKSEPEARAEEEKKEEKSPEPEAKAEEPKAEEKNEEPKKE